MKLHATDGNPIPEGATVAGVRSAGVELRVARWRTDSGRPRGTVCVVQGRNESIEKYFETIADLRNRGFWVVAFDLRGQGGSERLVRNPRKGHVDSFSDYEADLAAVMRDVALPDCPPPYFALAHSTGGMACLRAVRSGAVRFNRVVLTSPFLDFGRIRVPVGAVRAVSTIMTAVGLGEVSVRSEGPRAAAAPVYREDNLLTSDVDRFMRNLEIVTQHPELRIGAPTFGWLFAAFSAIGELADPSFAEGFRCPLLVVGGSAERLVSLTAMEKLVRRVRGAGMVTIKGGRHEVLMERDIVREQFWAAFDAFVPGSG